MLVGRSVARPRLHPDARSGRPVRLGDRARGGLTAIRPAPSARPTVSVVIPVRDDAGHLRACLQALARQTVAPDEGVVVDNASRDDSAEVAREAGARVVREPVVGIPAAASAGYDAARHEVISRLDADCVPPADWIERLGDVLAARPDVAAVTGAARFLDGPRALRGVAAVAYLGAYFVSVTLALGHPPLFGSNFALRRDAWLSRCATTCTARGRTCTTTSTCPCTSAPSTASCSTRTSGWASACGRSPGRRPCRCG